MKITKITLIAFFAAIFIAPLSSTAKEKNDSLALNSSIIEYASGSSDILISYPQLKVPGSATIVMQTMAKNLNQDACRMVARASVFNKKDSASIEAAAKAYSSDMLEMFVLQQSHISENEQSSISHSAYELYSEWAAYANEHILSIFQKISVYNGGAHPSTTSKVTNYMISDGERFSFGDYIDDKEGFMKQIIKYFCKERHLSTKSLKVRTGLKFELADLPFPNDIGLCNEGLVALYQEGEIAPRNFGVVAVVVPFRDLKDLFGPKFFKIKSMKSGIKAYNKKTKKYAK